MWRSGSDTEVFLMWELDNAKEPGGSHNYVQEWDLGGLDYFSASADSAIWRLYAHSQSAQGIRYSRSSQ